MAISPDATAAEHAALLARLDNLKPGKPHRRLMVMGGLGYTSDSFDGALMGYALAALIVIWKIPSSVSGWLLSSLFFGYLVGALLAGVLADRFGRRRLMMTSLLIFCACSLLMGTAHTVAELFIWRALAGVGIGAETVIIAPYISEFLPAKVRGKFVSRTVGFLAIGYILAGVLAPIIISPNPEVGWRIAAVVTALPVLALLWWRRSLPESPRYLLAKGRVAEATAVIESLERGTDVDPVQRAGGQTGSAPVAGSGESPAVRPVVAQRGPFAQIPALWKGSLSRTTSVIWALWFLLTAVNYGFTTWLPALLVAAKGFTLTGSFVFALVTAIAQVPGYYVASLLIDRMERKWLIALYATGATVAAIIVAVANSNEMLLLGCAMLGAFTNGVAAVYYTYTAELYPTAIRATGMGTASAIGRVGAIAAPVAIGYLYAGLGFTNVFFVLVGALALAVAIVVIFGERTSGRSLNEDVPVHA
ncbi:MFS transporter [Arthrobacter sp. RAF14]|uniref:MFS transporter n=1 Tax=Arthrobacter sp. RAF14 TaxID=3233051 RepID=UPI003F906E70